jgi:hypothetical protein
VRVGLMQETKETSGTQETTKDGSDAKGVVP